MGTSVADEKAKLESKTLTEAYHVLKYKKKFVSCCSCGYRTPRLRNKTCTDCGSDDCPCTYCKCPQENIEFVEYVLDVWDITDFVRDIIEQADITFEVTLNIGRWKIHYSNRPQN